jgi:hypothetical protein
MFFFKSHRVDKYIDKNGSGELTASIFGVKFLKMQAAHNSEALAFFYQIT